MTLENVKCIETLLLSMEHGTAAAETGRGVREHARPCFDQEAMSTETRTGLQDSGTDSLGEQLSDQLARSFTLGTDADGYDHHYYRPADAVVVFDGRELDRVEYLDGATLKKWVRFVAQGRGWDCKGPHADHGVAVDLERKTGDN